MNKTRNWVAGMFAIALSLGGAGCSRADQKGSDTIASQSHEEEARLIAAACARDRREVPGPRCNELPPPLEYDKIEGGVALRKAVGKNVETARALIAEAIRSGVQSREDGVRLMKVVATLPPRAR